MPTAVYLRCQQHDTGTGSLLYLWCQQHYTGTGKFTFDAYSWFAFDDPLQFTFDDPQQFIFDADSVTKGQKPGRLHLDVADT